ncbi:MAG: site-2 protease family protein [Clostridia bacterium]|nr:site-2 protease family protein [Clostridia bacterium]
MEKSKVHVGLSFVFYCALILMLGQIRIFVVYTASVLLHEAAHFFVARRLGYRVERIVMSVFGGAMYGEYDSMNRSDEIKIAIAGPIANLAVVVFLYALWWAIPVVYNVSYDIAQANLALAFINLLPCYTLDGGRILASLAEHKSRSKAIKLTKLLSFILGGILFAAFVLLCILRMPNFTLGIFAFFVVINGMMTVDSEMYERVMYGSFIKDKIMKGLEVKTIAVGLNTPLITAYKKLSRNYCYFFVVIDENGKKITELSADTLEKQIYLLSPSATFGQLLAKKS